MDSTCKPLPMLAEIIKGFVISGLDIISAPRISLPLIAVCFRSENLSFRVRAELSGWRRGWFRAVIECLCPLNLVAIS